ncbi:MAG: tetratricopeptide (TPR) repeat protein [Crocinitomix sp.]|jgi:tetratricopeptide (TPR) repeat protein
MQVSDRNNMKSWKILAVLVITLCSMSAFGQKLTKDEKQITKCWKVFNTKSYTKGIGKLEKYMSQQEWPSLLAYESLVSMHYADFNRNANIFGFDLKIEVDGVENDSLTKTFQEMLEDIYRSRFLNVCRMSTMESTSPSADVYLRQLMVDIDPDTSVSEKGAAYYSEAEEFFVNGDFELAESNYRKALKEDTAYYKAHLYLGDSFWAREEYDSAQVYYKIARNMQPNLLEPRIYIIDALVEQELFYRAKKECIEALTVYPGQNLKYKLQRVLYIENKFMNEHRVNRRFYANDMSIDEQPALEGNMFWADYRKAKAEVSKYCNDDGIIEENGETDDRYLEVYSFRRMLEQHMHDLPEPLHFADKMREEGFLEPYIFVSLFHIDIYPQFKDYMSEEANREKTIDFVEKYLIEVI